MKRALISVSNKENLIWFAEHLVKHNYELVATGTTKKMLEEGGLSVISVEDVTGFPEILDGRVKTLHPKIHGGLLSVRDKPSHIKQNKEHEINYIDMLVVNLYPFEQVVNSGGSFEEAIENIDIGGPALIRSAAKNFKDVTVICDPSDYQSVVTSLESNDLTEINFELAKKAFKHTAKYDKFIANYLNDELLSFDFEEGIELRYGENPHQKASVYKNGLNGYSVINAEQLNGKQLSYNNILDGNAALNIIKEFSKPACVAVKHLNPCGVGEADNLELAFNKAYECDKQSIFGGIVAFNEEVNASLATELSKIFLEIILAPSFSEEALEILKQKQNVRVMQYSKDIDEVKFDNIVSVNGGVLVQEVDTSALDSYECVTKNCDYSEADIRFAWKVCKHVKSNGVVVATDTKTVGVGVGQTSRVGACKLAFNQAKENGAVSNLTLASDAFFPFDDAVTLAAEYGVKVIIQPGGSVNDEKVIAKCNELGITMLFTGIRNFKH